MGKVDGHSHVIHSLDDFYSKFAQASRISLVHPVADEIFSIIGYARDADALGVKLVYSF